MHPRADLRGGNTSDDSFAMSKSILRPFTARCALAVGDQNPRNEGGIGCAYSDSNPLGRGSTCLSYRLSGAISREDGGRPQERALQSPMTVTALRG